MKQPGRLQSHLSLLRSCVGWKAQDLAELLEVSRQTISAWENYDESTGKKGVRFAPVHYFAVRKLLEDEIARDVPEPADRKKHIAGTLLEVFVDHPERYTDKDKVTVISEAELLAPSIVKYPERRRTVSQMWPSMINGYKDVISTSLLELLGLEEKKEEQAMDGIKKFVELMNTDEAFQAKLKEALAKYDGEKTEEAVFQNVLAPLASEYGITATIEEYKDYISDGELSTDELEQVAGGSSPMKINKRCTFVGNSGDETNPCPCGIPNHPIYEDVARR